ncbi:MAG: hypothetical protein SO169_11325, partial [Parabacteroides sp.]|nr:hypothetical protein [Parabacteroides sp.]
NNQFAELINPDIFVKTYLINEVDRLMIGLRNIMVNPQGVIDKFKREKDHLPADYKVLRFIEPMSEYSVTYYNLCPKEYPVVFKCEKFSNTIKMLEKLKEIIPMSILPYPWLFCLFRRKGSKKMRRRV